MRFSRPKTGLYEQKVQRDLAVTPSQMQELARQGIPISTQNLGLGYQDGVSTLDFTPPPEYQRGVDMNDLWNLRNDIKGKVRRVKQGLADGSIKPMED